MEVPSRAMAPSGRGSSCRSVRGEPWVVGAWPRTHRPESKATIEIAIRVMTDHGEKRMEPPDWRGYRTNESVAASFPTCRFEFTPNRHVGKLAARTNDWHETNDNQSPVHLPAFYLRHFCPVTGSVGRWRRRRGRVK